MVKLVPTAKSTLLLICFHVYSPKLSKQMERSGYVVANHETVTHDISAQYYPRYFTYGAKRKTNGSSGKTKLSSVTINVLEFFYMTEKMKDVGKRKRRRAFRVPKR